MADQTRVYTQADFQADFALAKAALPWTTLCWWGVGWRYMKQRIEPPYEVAAVTAALQAEAIWFNALPKAEKEAYTRGVLVGQASVVAEMPGVSVPPSQPQQTRSQPAVSQERAELERIMVRQQQETERMEERLQRMEELRRRDIATPIPPGWQRAEP